MHTRQLGEIEVNEVGILCLSKSFRHKRGRGGDVASSSSLLAAKKVFEEGELELEEESNPETAAPQRGGKIPRFAEEREREKGTKSADFTFLLPSFFLTAYS